MNIELEFKKLFSELDDQDIKALLKSGKPIEFNVKDIIIEENNNDNCLFIIISGSAYVKKIGLNKELILSELKSGDLIGELALLLEQPRTARVEAKEKCLLFKITKEKFESYSEKYPKLYYRLTKIIAKKLVSVTRVVAELAFDDISERLLKLLKNLGEVGADGRIIIREMPSQLELAKQVNASRETISRTLSLLEQCNLIERWDRTTCIIK